MNPGLPWLPSGTVYGTLLNFHREYALWAPKMNEAPYKAPPEAPVLYVKTANTFAPDQAAVAIDAEVELGATVGLVMGHEGMGCVLMDDLSLAHASYYRPPIRWRNRDGFLVCGPQVTPRSAIDLTSLRLEVRVNGQLKQTVELSTLVRAADTLLADVSRFMTLQPGDVLMLGTDSLADGTRVRARPGDSVRISAPGLAPLAHTLVAEAA